MRSALGLVRSAPDLLGRRPELARQRHVRMGNLPLDVVPDRVRSPAVAYEFTEGVPQLLIDADRASWGVAARGAHASTVSGCHRLSNLRRWLGVP